MNEGFCKNPGQRFLIIFPAIIIINKTFLLHANYSLLLFTTCNIIIYFNINYRSAIIMRTDWMEKLPENLNGCFRQPLDA